MEFELNKSDWKPVTFGDVVQEVRQSTKDPVADGIERVVGLEHIEPECIHLRDWASIEEETTFTKTFRKGHVLFGRRRAYLKKAALAEFDGICSGDITVMEAKEDLIPELLPFLVCNDKFFDYAVQHSAGGLSPRTKFKDLANYEFLLPPKDQQAKLAELLWAADDVIWKEIYAQQLLSPVSKSALIGKIIDPPEPFKDNARNVKLDDVIGIKHGFPFKSEFWAEDDGNLPIAVTIGNYEYSGGFRFETTKIKCYSGNYPSDYDLSAGDLLLAMTCQTPDGSILGIPGIIPEDGRLYLHNQRIGKVENKNAHEVDPRFLYLVFLSDHFRKHVIASASGTKVLHTSPSKILTYSLLLPPIEAQREIVRQFEQLSGASLSVSKKILASRNLLKSLINQIF